MLRRWTFLVCALLTSPLVALGDFTTTFENFNLAPNSANNNAGSSNAFAVDGNKLNNVYDSTYGSSYGWAISNQTNTTSGDYSNQYSSITGGGAGGSSTYAVGFTYGTPAGNEVGMNPNSPGYISSNPFHPSDTSISLAAGATPESIQITNTTYSYLTMKNGSSFTTAFAQGDYQLLDIRGYDASGLQVGVVDFYLADYRSTNPANWSLVNTWQTVNLAALAGATTLQFGIQSSQNDPTYGVNTPAYFAADNFSFIPAGSAVAVPEPASFALMATGLLGVVALRRRGRRRRVRGVLGVVILTAGASATVRADYDPQIGQPGSLGIAHTSSAITEWSSSLVSLNRGPQDISNPASPPASYGDPLNTLGVNGDGTRVVSLGDGGSITVGFDRPIVNGAGADFAVFENGFLTGSAGLASLELGTVAVSSDGVHFFTFASVSLTQTTTQVGAFDSLDARNLNNLAGKYIAGYGTGFDLSELAGVSPFLNVNDVTEVRVTDVVGSIDPRYGTRDSLGNLINDPFTTPYASSGFDFNGVAAINAAAVPEPASLALVAVAMGIGGLVSRRRMVV